MSYWVLNGFSRAVQGFILGLLLLSASAYAQSPAEVTSGALTIKKINEVQLLQIITPQNRPKLINFWATWCDPCRDEFPELVALSAEFGGKVDVITISLDDPVEIDRDVLRFLLDVKATMPSYLLWTSDEGAVMRKISENWSGALPFTVIYDAEGKLQYQKMGRFKAEVIRAALARLSVPAVPISEHR